ncbi:MAG: hypothetical protein ACRDTZ_24830, partial [Pseudonocardiaceae bacterium]
TTLTPTSDGAHSPPRKSPGPAHGNELSRRDKINLTRITGIMPMSEHYWLTIHHGEPTSLAGPLSQ